MTLSHQVLHILAEDPLSRDDDSRLSCVLWKTFYPNLCENDKVSFQAIVNDLPKMDTISRARRIIQNTLGLYPPTSLNVAKGRKMKEEEWREAMRIEVTPAEAKKMLDILLKNKKII
jgi:hypothetical protein